MKVFIVMQFYPQQDNFRTFELCSAGECFVGWIEGKRSPNFARTDVNVHAIRTKPAEADWMWARRLEPPLYD